MYSLPNGPWMHTLCTHAVNRHNALIMQLSLLLFIIARPMNPLYQIFPPFLFTVPFSCAIYIIYIYCVHTLFVHELAYQEGDPECVIIIDGSLLPWKMHQEVSGVWTLCAYKHLDTHLSCIYTIKSIYGEHFRCNIPLIAV